MNIQFQFNQRTVLVTGGAQGIGFEITRRFLLSGAKVIVWDYSDSALDMAKKELAEFADRLVLQKVDVSSAESCLAAAQNLPSLNVLINNAGITRDKSFKKMATADWDAVINTNLSGLFHVTKSAFDKFDLASGHLRIINISSIVGLFGNFGQSNYAAAKAGVIGLTKTWAREFAKAGITVNAVAPGFISTKMTEAMPAEVLQSMAAKVPLQQLGQTSDIANACMFLASEEAKYISGAVLSVDGALTN